MTPDQLVTTAQRLPVLYIPHGGGPCFFMDWQPADTWTKMAEWLGRLANSIGDRPKAIIVVSAHWEEAQFTVTSHPHPQLIYDYYGFPPHTYQLQYPAAGSVSLAQKIGDLLRQADIVAAADPQRGFDHGVFIPFKLIFPEANIPIVQLSLKKGLDPRVHIQAGKALQSLRNKGILIVGSGMSYHNMQTFMSGREDTASDDFDQWLCEAIMIDDSAARNEQLSQWHKAPQARRCHPREEHLLPLMVIAGAAGNDAGNKIFSDRVMGATVSAFQFTSRSENNL